MINSGKRRTECGCIYVYMCWSVYLRIYIENNILIKLPCQRECNLEEIVLLFSLSLYASHSFIKTIVNGFCISIY